MAEFIHSQDFEAVTTFLSIDFISNIAFALVIMLVGFAVGRLVGVAFFKLLEGIELNKGLKNFAIRGFDTSRAIGNLVSWIIYIISVIVALVSLGVFREVLFGLIYFVAFVFVGSIILGFFFALPNFFAAFKVKKMGLKKGDLVLVNTVRGELVHIGYFNTRIKGLKNELFMVPNKIVKKKIKIIKHS
jgi:small-conductance mechanosensitive channel